jgi:hypothetical protein
VEADAAEKAEGNISDAKRRDAFPEVCVAVPPETETGGMHGEDRRGTWENPHAPPGGGTTRRVQASRVGRAGVGAPRYEL